MRQRAVRHREEIVESCRAWQAEDPKSLKGKWRGLYEGGGPLCLEIGSGKGRFICAMASSRPDVNYIACEGGENISVRILQKAAEAELSNLKVITEYITRPTDYFEEGELDGIYINFCDPWPKTRHANRRLTHHLFLEEYKKVIKKGGFLAFKTDNDPLFEFSLEEFELAGLKPCRITRDLHASEWNEDNIPTEYEERFSGLGEKINYAYILIA